MVLIIKLSLAIQCTQMVSGRKRKRKWKAMLL